MSHTMQRRTAFTVAGVLAAGGIATGGALAATGASASGTTSGSSSSSSSKAAPKPPAGAPAPGNPKYDADGTVTKVSSSSLTVRTLFGTSRTYALSSSTDVHAGPNTKASVSSIDTGEHVGVHGTKTSSGLKATSVDIRAAHIDGAVSKNDGSSITVTDPDGFTRSVSTTSSTKYTLDGKSASSSAVTSGRVVHAEGKVDSDGTTLDATRVDVMTKAPTPPAGGPGAGPAGHGPGVAKAPGKRSGGSSGSSTKQPSTAPSSGSGHAS